MGNYNNEALSRGLVGGIPNNPCKHCGKLYTK